MQPPLSTSPLLNGSYGGNGGNSGIHSNPSGPSVTPSVTPTALPSSAVPSAQPTPRTGATSAPPQAQMAPMPPTTGVSRTPEASGVSSGASRLYPTSSPTGNSEALSKTNLYIRGLEPEATDEFLAELCRKFGKIQSTKAILDKATRKCKGYGFVDFEDPASAQKAIKGLTEANILAQMARQQEQDPTNLYIANLPLNITEEDLRSMLSHHANVSSIRILTNGNSISKGVGFARMDSKDQCEKIIKEFNNRIIPGGTQPLLVKFADLGGSKKKLSNSGIRNTKDYYYGWDREQTFGQSQLVPSNNSILSPVSPNSLSATPIRNVMPYYYFMQPQMPAMDMSSYLSGVPMTVPEQVHPSPYLPLNHMHMPTATPQYLSHQQQPSHMYSSFQSLVHTMPVMDESVVHAAAPGATQQDEYAAYHRSPP